MSVAQRVAEEMDVALGQEVGYSIRQAYSNTIYTARGIGLMIACLLGSSLDYTASYQTVKLVHTVVMDGT